MADELIMDGCPVCGATDWEQHGPPVDQVFRCRKCNHRELKLGADQLADALRMAESLLEMSKTNPVIRQICEHEADRGRAWQALLDKRREALGDCPKPDVVGGA